MTIGWEWIAGFFEGEGHIYWQEGRRGTKHAMGGRLIIGQKDKRPLQAIYDFLIAEGFSLPQFYLRPAAKTPRSTDCWILTVCTRRDVVRMLDAMLPWLFQKTEKAEMVRCRLLAAIKERDALLSRAFVLRADGATWSEVSIALGVGRVALSNYARSKGVALRMGRKAA